MMCLRFRVGSTITLLGVALLAAPAGRAATNGTEEEPLVGRARAVELVLDSPLALEGMTWQRYRKTVSRFSSLKSLVPLDKALAGETGEVRYGLNAVLPVGSSRNTKNLSWALISRNDQPRFLLVDFNGNGDLSDEARIEFVDNGSRTYEAERRLVLSGPDRSEVEFLAYWRVTRDAGHLQLSMYNWRERRGTIAVGGEVYEFALRTTSPAFDSPGSLVGVDLNRDGTVDFLDDDSEAFDVEHGKISVGGLEYGLSVDPSGESLTLTPTGRPAVAPPRVVVGARAPTLPGSSSLSIGDGEPLFLNFWSPSCSFSRRMAPQLARARRELRGLRFVSITDADADEARHESAEYGSGWQQIEGEEGETLFSLYRVDEVPTFVVIDAQGIILARGTTLEWPQLRKELERVSRSAVRSSVVAPKK